MTSSASSATVHFNPLHETRNAPAQATLRAEDIAPRQATPKRSDRSLPAVNRPNIYILPQGMMRDPYQHGPFDAYHQRPSSINRRQRLYDQFGRSVRDRHGRPRYAPGPRRGLTSRARPLGSRRSALRRRYQDLYTRHRRSSDRGRPRPRPRPSTRAKRKRKATTRRTASRSADLDRQLRALKRQMLLQSEIMRTALQRNRKVGRRST